MACGIEGLREGLRADEEWRRWGLLLRIIEVGRKKREEIRRGAG